MMTRRLLGAMGAAALLALSSGAQASILYGDANAGPNVGPQPFNTSTRTANDDSAVTSTTYLLTYTETVNDLSEIRVQDPPFGNGGTLFIASLPGTEQTATVTATSLDGTKTAYDTSSVLTMTADMGSNFAEAGGVVTSGILLGDLLISWNPGGTTYSAGLVGGTRIENINGATLAGGAATPQGGAGTLASIVAIIVENGANYDVTLTVGGSANNFSATIASVGAIDEVGFLNGGGGGNTNVDNLQIDGVGLVPEPASMALLGLGGLLMLSRRRNA